MKSQSGVAAESCNSETASDAKRRSGKAASGKLVCNQHKKCNNNYTNLLQAAIVNMSLCDVVDRIITLKHVNKNYIILDALGQRKKRNAGDFKCTMPSWLSNSTQSEHTSKVLVDHNGLRQTTAWKTIKQLQGLLQPQGELYPNQSIFNHHSWDQLLEFRTSFYATISRELLVQGDFKHTQFSRKQWYWRDSNSQPLALKVSPVSTELTWTREDIIVGSPRILKGGGLKSYKIVKGWEFTFFH